MTGPQILCQQCKLLTQPDDQKDSLIVHAPIYLPDQTQQLFLNLRCTFDSGCHRIALESIMNKEGTAIEVSDANYRQIITLLDKLARARVCGNQTICPKEVVRLVEAASL